MKRRTIKRILRKKFDEFLESIEDQSVRKLVEQNSIITGGAISSMLLHEKVNDFDVYFTNSQTALAVANYYVDRFKLSHDDYDDVMVNVGPGDPDNDLYHKPLYDEDRVWIYVPSNGVAGDAQPGIAGQRLGDDGEELEETTEDDSEQYDNGGMPLPPYRPVFLSQNAITLSDKIQLIVRFFGEPDEIHQYYDFAHCMNYWVSKTDELVLRPEALECLLARELRYVGSKYPVCSIIRTRKFIKRGFSITAGQYLKMILQCNELDLFNLDVLEDQLVGVDSAYFMQVIDAVKAKRPENLNSAYICEIIDRIF